MKVEFSRGVIIRFLISVLFVLGVSLLVHYFLEKSVSRFVIVLSYLVQLVLSIASFVLLSRVSASKGEQAGFFFLGLSFVKFLVYFVGFRLYFIQDGEVTRGEYAVFFVPYILAFLIEVGYLISVLNAAPIDPDKVVEFSDEEE